MNIEWDMHFYQLLITYIHYLFPVGQNINLMLIVCSIIFYSSVLILYFCRACLWPVFIKVLQSVLLNFSKTKNVKIHGERHRKRNEISRMLDKIKQLMKTDANCLKKSNSKHQFSLKRASFLLDLFKMTK